MNLIVLFLCLSFSVFAVDFTLFTEPKTGTHLLIPILEELTGKKVYWAPEFSNTPYKECAYSLMDLESSDSFLFSTDRVPWDRLTMERVWNETKRKRAFLHLHAPYSLTMENYLTEKKYINFFVKRDPRDQVVSLMNHYKYVDKNNKSLNDLPSDEEKLLFLIQTRLKNTVLSFKGWMQSPLCCVLDFHKLMGSHGGDATDREALEELKKIAKALSIQLTDVHLLILYKKHFGKGWNFFRGKVGAWRDYFNEEHKTATKKEIGHLLIELGYEADDQW